MTLFVQTGVTAEIIMLVLSIMMLGFINISKPRKTKMLQMVFVGFIYSIIAIVSNMGLFITTESLEIWNPIIFSICYVIFTLIYTLILGLLFTYIDYLSYARRANLKYIHIMQVVMSAAFFLCMLYPLVTGKLVQVTSTRVIITAWYNVYVYCGLIDVVLCLVTVLVNRKTVASVVVGGTIVFCTMDALILIAQIFCNTAVFTSATYVVAFLIFYILFHCSTYDEVSGCQSVDSLTVRLEDIIKSHKRFVLITASFPALQKREFIDNKALLDYCSSYMCREIERTGLGARIYQYNSHSYCVLCEEKKSNTAELLIKKVMEVLGTPMVFDNNRVDARYKLLIIHDSPRFSCADNVKSVIRYENNRFLPNLENEVIDVDDYEISRVEEADIIEQQLFDIRNKMDFDDERVVCFAQPIFCVKTDSFVTAEALMRMKIDGKLVFPDKFIPIAENNGCIHSLTLIMLNKVCRFIKEAEKNYSFDAITVNCSTVEMDDRNLHRELKEIIERNGVDPSKIRLEITESIDVSRYDNVLYNMQKLNEYGVHFYLDDFGTGYSNLERIVSYPFHTIKFDKNILYKALDDNKADAVLDSTVQLFADTGFSTVIEGVENEEQIQYAKEKGFGFIQGYMYSKPVEIEKLKEFFSPIAV